MGFRRIPISAARRLGSTYQQDQVILITFDRSSGRTHVVTWGKTVEDCAQAAEGGNKLKHALGWPEDKCRDEPSRVRKLLGKIQKVRDILSAQEVSNHNSRLIHEVKEALR